MALTVALLFAIGAFHVFAAIGGIFAAWLRAPRLVLLRLLIVWHEVKLRSCPPVPRQLSEAPGVPTKCL